MVEEAGVDVPKMFVVLGPQVTIVKMLFETIDKRLHWANCASHITGVMTTLQERFFL